MPKKDAFWIQISVYGDLVCHIPKISYARIRVRQFSYVTYPFRFRVPEKNDEGETGTLFILWCVFGLKLVYFSHRQILKNVVYQDYMCRICRILISAAIFAFCRKHRFLAILMSHWSWFLNFGAWFFRFCGQKAPKTTFFTKIVSVRVIMKIKIHFSLFYEFL